MVKQAKANGGQELSAAAERSILEKLTALGKSGQWSAEFLTKSQIFPSWYINARSRIQLGRHIVAAVLFDQVFSPFAFGLPQEWAQALQWVERNINAHGVYPVENC